MSAKQTPTSSKAIAVVFTFLVAPLAVNVVTEDVKHSNTRSGNIPAEARPVTTATATQENQTASTTPQHNLPDQITRVITEGTGKSADDALRNAARAALKNALVAELDADIWARRGPVLLEEAWRARAGIILGWRELRATKQFKLIGTQYRSEVEIVVDRRNLIAITRALPLR